MTVSRLSFMFLASDVNRIKEIVAKYWEVKVQTSKKKIVDKQ